MTDHIDNVDVDATKKPSTGNWQVKFRKLKKFEKSHGHIDPNHDDMGPRLSRFLKNQLKKDQVGALAEPKKRKLESLGVDFTADNVAAVLEKTKNESEAGTNKRSKSGEGKKYQAWKKKYQALVDFHKENGTCNVPADHPLAKWVKIQKKRSTKKVYNPKKVELLNELGFDWGKSDGTTTLSEKRNRRRALNEGGFDWVNSDGAMTLSESKNRRGPFQKKFRLLRDFKDEHGDCNVPEDHPVLGRWVKSLRTRHASGALKKNHAEKVKKLTDLGFDWSETSNAVSGAKSTSKLDVNRNFQKKVALLRAYKDENGDCNVPETHPKLGKMVKNLRTRYASGVLQKKQPGLVDKLTKLGFEWTDQEEPEFEVVECSSGLGSKKE